jgi:hypothetical protein
MATHDPSTKDKVKVVGNQVLATSLTKVHIPAHFIEKGLLKLTEQAECIGMFNVIIGDKYFVIMSPLIYTLPYSSFSVQTIGEEEYIELVFTADTPIIESLEVAKNAPMTVELLIYLMLRGQMPYYITPELNLVMLTWCSDYAGISLDSNPALLEVLAGLSQRAADDKLSLYRHNPNGKYQYVPLTDVSFGTFSTFSRLLNGHQASAMITSLTSDKPTLPSKLETILRR